MKPVLLIPALVVLGFLASAGAVSSSNDAVALSNSAAERPVESPGHVARSLEETFVLDFAIAPDSPQALSNAVATSDDSTDVQHSSEQRRSPETTRNVERLQDDDEAPDEPNALSNAIPNPYESTDMHHTAKPRTCANKEKCQRLYNSCQTWCTASWDCWRTCCVYAWAQDKNCRKCNWAMVPNCYGADDPRKTRPPGRMGRSVSRRGFGGGV